MKFFLFSILLFIPLVSWAGGDDCVGVSNCNKSTNIKNNETSVATNSDGNLALGLSGGDMDIRDCLATEGILFGLWQRTKPNKLCMANRLQAAGKVVQAAKMRCSFWSISRQFGGKKNCIEVLTFENYVPPVPEPAIVVSEDDDDEHDEVLRQLEQLQQQVDEAPLVQPPPQKIIVEDNGAERRAQARKALGVEE